VIDACPSITANLRGRTISSWEIRFDERTPRKLLVRTGKRELTLKRNSGKDC